MTKLDPRIPPPHEGVGARISRLPSRPPVSSNVDDVLTSPDSGVNWPLIPWARGPLSAAVINALQRGPGAFGTAPPIDDVDVLLDDDFQLALYLCYETHHRDFNGADWEWDAELLSFRAQLEHSFEARLRDETSRWDHPSTPHVLERLDALYRGARTAELVTFVDEVGNLDQLRELCVHESVVHLHEDESHSLSLAHLTGEARGALADLQRIRRGHDQGSGGLAMLYGDTMVALGLDPSSGSYVEMTPGATLAMVNLASMFAFHRRFRGEFVGQLALWESSSAHSMQMVSGVLEKFGVGPEGRQFFDVYARVDPRDARIVADRIVPGFLAADPELANDVVFGATASVMLEGSFVTHVLAAWERKATSLAPWTMFDQS